ncbi:MAG: hypothetical protein HRT54_07110 [Colwellia sp.]|nr:hypothetical protein [Colwellia sp.]
MVEKYGITGLGLIICTQLIKQMNGQLTVVNTKGRRTIFTFELPLNQIEKLAKII